MGLLDNKTALITGAASGIGRASALLFSQEGASVVLADVNVDGGLTLQKEIESLGGRAEFVPCDVTRSDECKSAFEGIHPTFRQVPPRVSRFSTQAVLRPSCAALIAAT